jgi:hypothetical protein
MNQTQQDTPLFEELSGEVTITDPTHPLYGQTLPCISVRVHRSKTHVTVLLPTGRRRSVPRSATNLERRAEEVLQSSKLRASSHSNQIPPVPATIWHQLPTSSQQQLAHLVAQLIQRVRRAKSDKGHNDEC